MAIEKKAVNTFWFPEKSQWGIYINPENPDPDNAVFLPRADSIENSILRLRRTIAENKTYKKFTDRVQKNYAAILDGKTEIEETHWSSIGTISGNAVSSVLAIVVAMLFYLRSTSAASAENSTNISQPPNSSPNLDANLAIGIGLVIIVFVSNITFAWISRIEEREGKLYEHMKKIMGLLTSVENEIRKKEEIIRALEDKFKSSHKKERDSKTIVSDFDSETDDESQENLNIINNIEYDFYSEMLILIDSRNDMGFYERAYELYHTLEDISYYNINEIMLEVFKEKILDKLAINITEIEITQIKNTSSIQEILVFFKENKQENLEEATELLFEHLENQNKLIAVSSLMKLISHALDDKDVKLINNSLLNIQAALGMWFIEVPHKFEIIHQRISDIFKDPEKLQNIVIHIKELRKNYDDDEEFIEKYVFFLGDTKELKRHYDSSSSNKKKEIKSSLEQAGKNSPIGIWNATLPDSEISIEFEENLVIPNGDCGFIALGTDRKTLSQKLLSLKHTIEARQFLAEEIINAFLTYSATKGGDGLAPPENKKLLWNNLQQECEMAQQEFNIFFSSIQDGLQDKTALTQDDIQGSIKWLQNNNKQDEAKALQQSLTKVLSAEEKRTFFCEESAIFEHYINALRDTRLWLGYKSALLYAENSNINLYIWRKNTKVPNQLALIRSHYVKENINEINMLHTNSFTHFNLLSKKPTQEAKKNDSNKIQNTDIDKTTGKEVECKKFSM